MSQASHPLVPESIGAPSVWQRLEGFPAKMLGMVLGLVLIVTANFILRHNLEHAQFPDHPTLQEYRVALSWELLLPLDYGEATGEPIFNGVVHWCTTGIVVVQFLGQHFALTKVFYALNAALIVSSFVLSWWMFRSAVFSFTLTICMAFGTQLHWAYACAPVIALYLFVIYLEFNLLCLVKLLQTGTRNWQIAFTLSLIPLALCAEYWLDYFAFLTVGSVFLLVYAWRAPVAELKPRVLFALLSSWVIAGIYLAIRVSLGRQQYAFGHESEMIFTYTSPILAIEDFISNVISYLYIAISNYFPPFMVSSNSLYRLGAEKIVAEQHGYHEAKTQLVPMHHLFYWYFWAGIVFTIFLYYLIRNARTALTQKSLPHVYLTMAMLLVLCGIAIHTLVKYRPYLSVPLLTYRCIVSNVGAAFLLSLGLMYARDQLPWKKALYPAVVLLVWGVIGYGALTRPHYLNHLSREVGMGSLPDPRRNLSIPGLMRKVPAAPSAQSKQ